MLSCMSCLYILKFNPLSVASFANIFSQSEGCHFILFMAGQPSNHTASVDPGASLQSLCFSDSLEGIWLRGGAEVTWSLFASLKNSFTELLLLPAFLLCSGSPCLGRGGPEYSSSPGPLIYGWVSWNLRWAQLAQKHRGYLRRARWEPPGWHCLPRLRVTSHQLQSSVPPHCPFTCQLQVESPSDPHFYLTNYEFGGFHDSPLPVL